jgi:hypothetical protein
VENVVDEQIVVREHQWELGKAGGESSAQTGKVSDQVHVF